MPAPFSIDIKPVATDYTRRYNLCTSLYVPSRMDASTSVVLAVRLDVPIRVSVRPYWDLFSTKNGGNLSTQCPDH
jgi:hypothetical protein